MAIILTIDPSHEISDIILRLSKANLEVISAMPLLNIITVAGNVSDMTKLGIIPGIIAIENDSEVKIAKEAPFIDPGIVRKDIGWLLDNDLDDGFITRTIN